MTNWRLSASCLLFLSICTFVAGCGSATDEPKLGIVTGVVLVDGKPESDLEVVFEPQVSPDTKDASKLGAPSNAMTDKDGKYQLKYKGASNGAVIGKHLVRITRITGGGPAGGATAAAGLPPLPAKYNVSSKTTVDVVAGKNTHDFDIKTK